MRLITKKDKVKGLHVHCNKCDRRVINKCSLSSEKPNKCQFQDHWKYVMSFHVPVPGGPGKKRTKTCKSNTLEGAMIELFQEKEVLKGQKAIHIFKDRTFLEGMKIYLDKKFNKGEFVGQSKVLSSGHKDEIIRVLERFADSLRMSGINPEKILLNDLDDRVIAPFYAHVRTFAKSTSVIDRHTRIMRNFFKFLTDRGVYKGANFFKTVDLNPITASPVSIDDEELKAVLRVITAENGSSRITKGKGLNFFRPWMAYAFLIARYTGLRTEEIYELKWDDIVTVGEHKLLIVHNLKVERLKNQENILKVVPVTSKLEELLIEIRESNFSDIRVLETGYNCEYFGDLVGRAFSHFYKIAYPGKKHKLFKQLRKKQMSDIYALLGADAYKLSDHSGNVILERHYVDKVQAAIRLLEMESVD